MSNSNTQLKYINGLKGLACIMVMFGHFIGLYKNAESFPANSEFLQLFGSFLNSKLDFVISESFWVILFFTVSGYLVSISKIPDLKSLIFKSFSRFLRLGLPILVACALIFVIQKTFGFYTVETLSIFESSFVQKSYTNDFVLWQVIKSPVDILIFGETDFCSPYWVLREMFVTSLMIYFFSFLKERINIYLFIMLLGFSLLGSMSVSNVVFAGLFGMTLNFIQNDTSKKLLKNKLLWIFALAICVSLFFVSGSRKISVFFGVVILIVPKIKIFNSIFSCKFSQLINKISFGIYSFHWPLFCSVGMYTIIKTHENYGLINSVIFSFAISTIATIIISILYYHLFEKQIYKGLKALDNLWKKKFVNQD